MKLVVLCFLLLSQMPMLSPEQTKDVVQSMATSMRDAYVDAETGRRVAELLEAKHARDQFDRTATPSEFANILTKLLQEETRDLHLRVRLGSAASQERPAAVRRERSRSAEMERPGTPSMVGRVEMLPRQMGYLEVKNFATDNVAEFERAIELVRDAKALILDLRQCPGGGPTGVRFLSTYFFSKPTHLVSTFTRGTDAPSERWTLKTVPGPRLVDVPVYILTSKRTFSAGESFTFGLKVTGRAVIVGEKTAGGGHFGNFVPLPHGFEMFLPIGRTYDPRTGKGWEADGIRPDIETPPADALEAAIKHYTQLGQPRTGSPN